MEWKFHGPCSFAILWNLSINHVAFLTFLGQALTKSMHAQKPSSFNTTFAAHIHLFMRI